MFAYYKHLVVYHDILYTCMTFSYSPLSNSSSGSDRHGILSTMHLDIGSKEWNQSCSKWLSHLEIPQDRTDDRETGVCVCVSTCIILCACVYNMFGLAVMTLSKSLYPIVPVYIAGNWLQQKTLTVPKIWWGPSLDANTTPVVLSM